MNSLEQWNSVRSACSARVLPTTLSPANLVSRRQSGLYRTTERNDLTTTSWRPERTGKPVELGRGCDGSHLQCIRRDLRFEAINEAEAVIEIRRNGLGVRTAPASRRARLIHWASLLRSDDSLEFSTVKGRLSILHFGIMRISPRCNIKPICFP